MPSAYDEWVANLKAAAAVDRASLTDDVAIVLQRDTEELLAGC
ncbi:MAG: hypothetical protein ACE1ZE_08380 [Candidatus Binatia bacterium]